MIRYMLSDGHNQYLRRDGSGNYVPVKSKILGDIYDSRKKASNVLSSCVNKNLRGRYRVFEVEVPESNSQSVSTTTNDVVKSSSKNTENNAIKPKDNVVKSIAAEEIEESQIPVWQTTIETFANFAQDAEQRREYLSNALSDVDKEITDINHYIEFGTFNAYQGWLAFNMLRHRLKKRRKIKNELAVLIQLGDCKINSSMIESMKRAINDLDNREYKPRRLNSLFQ